MNKEIFEVKKNLLKVNNSIKDLNGIEIPFNVIMTINDLKELNEKLIKELTLIGV